MKTTCLCFFAVAMSVWGQRVTDTRTASIRGGGGDGKCTIEVNVDDVAEVEVRGRTATVRTFSGSPASIRRFECNQEMPRNPERFEFKGIDGRGRQELVRDPSNGGRAVVRIQDSKGGTEGYTFDLTWTGGGGRYDNGGGFGGGRDRGDRDRGYDRDRDRGDNGGWNDGWGNGNGWTNRENFNFEGGRRGSGEFRDRSGKMRRLDSARVLINDSGRIDLSFDSDQGRLNFTGRIDRREGRRVFGQVRGTGAANGARGTVELEMSSRNQVRSITVPDVDLHWSN